MPETCDAVIEKLAFGGNGICRIDGKVCFVPFSCPGDVVRLKISARKSSYDVGEILEILTPSPARIEPVCPIFGSCGGCSWQHVGYPRQLEQKRLIFAETFWRGARVGAELIRNVAAAPEAFGYRRRMQFKVSAGHDGFQAGFFRHNSHSVVDAPDGCALAVPRINDLFKRFRNLLSQYPGRDAVSQITIDCADQGLTAIIHHSGKNHQMLGSFLRARAEELSSSCSGLFLQTSQQAAPLKLWGSEELTYAMPARDGDAKPSLLTFRAGGFAQVHQEQNRTLLSAIRQLGSFTHTDALLDLYCGNGNFSIPLSPEVASVIGIEGAEESVASAEHNRSVNQVSNVRFICGDVGTEVRRLARDGRTFGAVLLDPPRRGAADIIADLAALNPERILYVSCDPATLARDCALLGGCGYRVAESIPVDMFPQTYHLESVTLIVKK